MYDVKIINNEFILFDDNIQVKNLNQLRNEYGNIAYELPDGSCVVITRNNTIIWYDSDGHYHRGDDMPAIIRANEHIEYWNHGKMHRIGGPARIWPDGNADYHINGLHYTKVSYINTLNSNYGIIYNSQKQPFFKKLFKIFH